MSGRRCRSGQRPTRLQHHRKVHHAAIDLHCRATCSSVGGEHLARPFDLLRRGSEGGVNDSDLHVPHRELHNRPFWLRELAELESRLEGAA